MDNSEKKSPSQGQSKRPPRKPEQAGKKPVRTRPESERPQEKRTDQGKKPPEKRPRPEEENRKVPAKSRNVRASGKKPSSRPSGDSGYQPYKAANQQKKMKRKREAKKFFSAENPTYRSLAGMVKDFRKPRSEAGAKQKKKSRIDAPPVVYTQPKAFNRDRLLVQMLTVLAVVLALVMGLSVFFKVKAITVSGADVYSAWTIREASGISEGDNLLTFSRARASGQIVAKLPYVKTARIGIKLPDTVNIEIEEENVVYAIQADDGVWWLMTSGGKVVEQTTAAQANNYTQVLGVTIVAPQPGQQAVAKEEVPAVTASTEATGETAAETEPTVSLAATGAQRLSVAMEILVALEDNDIVGQAASVNVTRLDDIILWYGTQYQANLGGTNDLAYKIATMNDTILQLSDYQTGIMDLSFNTWKDQVGFTPFE